MWCIGALTEQYRQRMYHLLALYARPFRRQEPVVCVDEKSKQLLRDTRAPLPMKPGAAAKHDYEYVRAGTCNLFVAVNPKAGHRIVAVTEHRGKTDFVAFVRHLVERVYGSARRIHLVLDNLNIHFRKCFEDVLGQRATAQLLQRVQFHYTPKHASWLNMAEIEIGVLTRQCLDRRITDLQVLAVEVAAWQRYRNLHRRTLQWAFTRQDADRKLAHHYVA